MSLAGALIAAQALKAAGCPPGVAARMVATAARESGYNTAAHALGLPGSPCHSRADCGTPYTVGGRSAVCEDSWGLWQINTCPADRTGPLFNPVFLVTPVGNALAAKKISGGFADLSPWNGGATVTDEATKAVQIVYRSQTGPGPGGGGTGPCTSNEFATVIGFMQKAETDYFAAHPNATRAQAKGPVTSSTQAHFAKTAIKAPCVAFAIATFFGQDSGQVLPETIPGLIGNAPGDVISSVLRGPFDTVAGAIGALVKLLGLLLDPHTWLRIGAALLGVVLLVAALWFAAKDWQRAG